MCYMEMQEIMLKRVETEEVFFDSVDHLVVSGEDNQTIFDDFWSCGLRSVDERRASFLHETGLIDSNPTNHSFELDHLDRMVDGINDADLSSSSSSCSNDSTEESNLVFYGRECKGNASLVVDDENTIGQSVSSVCEDVEQSTTFKDGKQEYGMVESVNKKVGHWWKQVMKKRKGMIRRCKCETKKVESNSNRLDLNRTKVHVNTKRFKELSAVFAEQEIRAHKGIIRTMKFSPDGQYLASGGDDGVVRVWLVKCTDSCRMSLDHNESNLISAERFGFKKEKKVKVQVVIPEKIFQLEQEPFQEFYGHTGQVLDLAWSNSNCLLSSSTDKTVRLWKLGHDKCLNVFLHTDYVTCVQFNPTDKDQFISGSLDGKVRVWGVSKGRALDWADVRDSVTALCYQPDGQGFVVGCLRGTCRFYEKKGDLVELTAHILVHSSWISSTNKITGIQFCPDDSQMVMVMFGDSKVRIFDKTDVVCKYRGLHQSGSQMSASFTSNGRHIVSIGEDSHVYIWNHDHPHILPSKNKRSIRSCEHFYTEGVTVAVPWSGTETQPTSISSVNEANAVKTRHPPTLSLSNLFSSRSSATWPEDILPVFSHQATCPPTWGLIIVTANWDGVIRTFHNYGLPVKV